MRYSLLLAAAGATTVAASAAPMCRVKYLDTRQTAEEAAASPAAPAASNSPDCEDVHIFLSKGWNEPYPGRQGALAGAICSGVSSCGYEDILFANADGSDFCAAVSEGAKNGLAQLDAYAKKCPNSKLVLTGYSQGAFVTANILAGSGGAFSGGCTPDYNAAIDVNSAAAKQLKAILQWGDVQHTAGQSYNILSGADINSNDPLTGDRLTNMNRFSGILRSWCDAADPVCAAQGVGPFNVDKHLDYFDVYTQDAAVWVKTTLGI